MPSKKNRVPSEPSLNNSISKRGIVSPFAVTPKFNSKMPLIKDCVRNPQSGELLFSIRGSPLQNFADDIAISLGEGNIICFADGTEISKLDGDFMKNLDKTSKSTLENVKKKIDLILKT